MSIPNPTNNFERLLYRLATGMGIIPKKPSSRAEEYLMEIVQNGGFGSLKPTKVNTTTYPTLEAFLASTGEDKKLYLYPNAEEGYSEWIWLSEDSAYEKVGDTDVKLAWGSIDGDISNQTDLKTALDGKFGSDNLDLYEKTIFFNCDNEFHIQVHLITTSENLQISGTIDDVIASLNTKTNGRKINTTGVITRGGTGSNQWDSVSSANFVVSSLDGTKYIEITYYSLDQKGFFSRQFSTSFYTITYSTLTDTRNRKIF